MMTFDHVSTCIGCGCDDLAACIGPTGPCHWLRVDRDLGLGICSHCGDSRLIEAWDETGGVSYERP